MKKCLLLASASLLLILSACDDSGSDSSDQTTFKNESGATVTVKPQADETFTSFTIEPDNQMTVTRVGDTVEYTFQSTTAVSNSVVTKSEVVFTDPVDF